MSAAAQTILGVVPVPGNYFCPISGLPLNFEELIESTDLKPHHGRSRFAMGHVVPLGSFDGVPGRHVAENVVWMHEWGNRVQGNLSVDQTIAEIHRMSAFHHQRGH